jgi:uncharacterized protein involved in response to NO
VRELCVAPLSVESAVETTIITGKQDPAAIWTMAFRPFFLAASLWSAAALFLWVLVLAGGLSLPSRFDPPDWHIHEMLFGFVPAAIAGFILTAIPNWTGRLPVRGLSLAWLFILWCTGRLVCLVSAMIPALIAVVVDVAFLIVLAAIALRELLLAGNRRNLAMPVLIAVLAAANALMHLEALGYALPAGLGWRLGIAVVIMLITVIGGRIVPNFTRNWLSARNKIPRPPEHGPIDSFAIATLLAGLVAWAFVPAFRGAGVLLLVAAALNFWRLARWRGGATIEEPLLAILHLGYLWVAVGAGLLGASMITNFVPETAAIHALTAGAMGTMVVAVMGRAALGHTGHALHADRITVLIYGLVTIAALTRIAAAVFTSAFLPLILASGALWIAGFLLFALHYAPILIRPR